MSEGAAGRLITLQVAALSITASSRLTDQAPHRADLSLEVLRRPLASARRGVQVFDSGGVWKLLHVDDRHRFELFTGDQRVHPYKVAEIHSDWTHGEVILDENIVPPGWEALEYPLDELLFIHLLARKGGVEVHASGVIVGDEGYLFVGHSGAGKSTTARVWLDHVPEARVLSDDRIVLRRDTSSSLRMWGTPWHGTERHANLSSSAINGIFVLSQAPDTKVSRLSEQVAFAELMSRSFYPVYDPVAVENAADSIADVVASVPVYALSFRPDEALIEVVRSC